jgi:acetyl esterase/lipase
MFRWAALTFAGISLLAVAPPAPASPLTDEQLRLMLRMGSYAIAPNITYRTVAGWEGKLDVFVQRGAKADTPTLIYFHGGGWQSGTKEERMTLFFPHLAMGWNVINVEYRLARQGLAPAAAQDARCALWWLQKNANTILKTSSGPVPLKIDMNRVITSGTSAGGHLALLTAFATPASGLDEGCENVQSTDAQGNRIAPPKVAAVIDWFGISDVAGLTSDPKTAPLNTAWIGTGPQTAQTARQVSPITYVRPGLPPVISIHGDADPIVPIGQKRVLHEALERAGVRHEFIEVKGGGHGTFPGDAYFDAYRRIEAFLRANGVIAD